MRILVAEDHPTLAESIARGLRDEGYAVDLTRDGEEAMHWALTNQYGCIVLDIMMPGRDGWAVLRARPWISAHGTPSPTYGEIRPEAASGYHTGRARGRVCVPTSFPG